MRGPDAPASNGRRRASQTDDARYAGVTRPGASRTGPRPDRAGPGRTGGGSSSRRNWSVSTRLVALFVMASLLGLVFGGLRVADAVQTASDYSRTVQLADLGKQITALAQAMEDERDRTAGVTA